MGSVVDLIHDAVLILINECVLAAS